MAVHPVDGGPSGPNALKDGPVPSGSADGRDYKEHWKPLRFTSNYEHTINEHHQFTTSDGIGGSKYNGGWSWRYAMALDRIEQPVIYPLTIY